MSSENQLKISTADESDRAFNLIQKHLSAVTCELFDGYEMPVQAVPATQPPHGDEVLAAVIGFAGEGMRGALVLGTNLSAVERWRGALDGVQANGCDILSEFANMILGRLKGRLLGEGLPILMSTPTSASGSALTITPFIGDSKWLSFQGGDWQLAVRVDGAFEPAFKFGPVDTAPPAEPGEMLMF